jgi:hypothetical protein
MSNVFCRCFALAVLCAVWPGRRVFEYRILKLEDYPPYSLSVSPGTNSTHAPGAQVRHDLIMCEPRAYHGVDEIWLRILSNNPHVIQPFEIRVRK